MCYFMGSKVLKVHDLTEDEAIIAYKRLRFRYGFFSPIYNVMWEQLRLSNLYGRPGSRPDAVSGIYCFKNRKAADLHSNDGLVVKLKIWGRVVEHERGASWDWSKKEKISTRGYRAQHAKIVAVEVASVHQRNHIRESYSSKVLRFMKAS